MPILRSILAKFLALALAVFLLAAGGTMVLMAERVFNNDRSEMTARVGNYAARIAGFLREAHLKPGAREGSSLLGLLLADPAVTCAEVSVGTEIMARAPLRIGCDGAFVSHDVRISVPKVPGATMRIGFSAEELDRQQGELRLAAGAILLIGLVGVALAGLVGFQRVVGRPVGRLLNAIRRTTETGEAVLVPVSGNDELAVLSGRFNDMQVRLKDDARQIAAAFNRTRQIYNAVPALIFTMDDEGRVLEVSDAWVDGMRLPRERAVGRHFSEMLALGSRGRFEASALQALRNSGELREVPLRLWRSDGVETDVLLSAVRTPGQNDEYICVMSDVTRLRVVEKELRRIAVTDHLTGLPNRFGMEARISALAEAPENRGQPISILFIDLDNFKWINDTHGHAAGDRLLVEVARRIAEAAGPDAVVSRLGGDEFTVILTGVPTTDAAAMANRMIASIRVPVDLGGALGFVGASIGIASAIAGTGQAGLRELLRAADHAMYRAKEAGRNRIAFHDDGDTPLPDGRAERLERIRRGLENGWFTLYYQPVVDLQTLRPRGVEALLRLHAPGGFVDDTSDVIQTAENSGMMDHLGEFVLAAAAADFPALSSVLGPDGFLSVNLSPRQLDEAFVSMLGNLLSENRGLAGKLVLEIAETGLVERFDAVSPLLEEIRAMGVRIALDDFGAGFSSLSYANRLPIDMLKIDRSIVSCHPSEPAGKGPDRRMAVARAVGALAREIGVTVVAEGIEDDAVVEALRDAGAQLGQGFAFAAPMPLGACIDWIALFPTPARLSGLRRRSA